LIRTVASASDRDLVRRLRLRDRAAFDEAYERYAQRLFRFLLRLCQDRQAAEDALQDAWLKLADGAGELALSADTDLAAWLFTVARNAWISRRRREGRLVALSTAPDVAVERADPEASAAATGALAALESALAALPEADREILLLVGVEGLDPARAAGVLGLSHAACRQRLHRARQRLKVEMDARGPRRAAGDWTDE
jgi:RNA polymerase sigma-70 factor (ECF subfamily)